MSKLILITGGARSGKSDYAQKLAKSFNSRVIYIATAEPLDSEMRKRIAVHRRKRPRDWITIEEPIDILRAIKKLPSKKMIIVLDCLTFLISNLIFKGFSDGVIMTKASSMVRALKKKADMTILVTNEVGSGIVPDNRLARRFRDLQGHVNQIAAKEADKVCLLVSGIPVQIK